MCWLVSERRWPETPPKCMHGSVFSNHLALLYFSIFCRSDESPLLPLVIQVLWRTTLAVPWHCSLAELLGQVLPQHLCPENVRAVLIWSFDGIVYHFCWFECGSLSLGHTRRRANSSHVVVQYPDRRLRTPMSLAQPVLCGYGKMRGRLEATANLFYNLHKNRNSPAVVGFETKTIMSPNLLRALNNICVTLMLQRLLKGSVCSRVSFLKS